MTTTITKLSVIIFCLLGFLSGCGINNLPSYHEQIQSSWSQVENQYQRRADLIPNLVATVRGFVAQEKEVLVEVAAARASVDNIQVHSDIMGNPELLQQFEQSQSRLTAALSRLLIVSERYPQLRSSENFLVLQSQLEGTENRISVARRDYVLAVENYNVEIRTFPGKLWQAYLYPELTPHIHHYKATATAAEMPPKVQF